jgi:hypothetical protein
LQLATPWRSKLVSFPFEYPTPLHALSSAAIGRIKYVLAVIV